MHIHIYETHATTYIINSINRLVSDNTENTDSQTQTTHKSHNRSKHNTQVSTARTTIAKIIHHNREPPGGRVGNAHQPSQITVVPNLPPANHRRYATPTARAHTGHSATYHTGNIPGPHQCAHQNSPHNV